MQLGTPINLHPPWNTQGTRIGRLGRMKKSEATEAIVIIVLIALMFGFVWLLTGWVGVGFLALWVGGTLVVYTAWDKRKTAKNMAGMAGMAGELRRLAAGFHPIDDSYLSRKAGEYVFYVRDQVQLREYRSPGRLTTGGYGGASYRVSQNLRISGGGIKAISKALPEESTIIDVGEAIFTNQRVVFMGPNHTREWDLGKLLGLEISDNGFQVGAGVSGKQKTSALAGNCLGMITPGIAFALAAEIHQEGKESAENLARETAEKIEANLAAEKS
jgi:hypothetical protein